MCPLGAKQKPVPAERMTGNGNVIKRASKTATDTVESARGAALRAAMREYRADPAGRGGLQGTGGTLRDHHRLPYRADPA
jgi:hypothetical protein